MEIENKSSEAAPTQANSPPQSNLTLGLLANVKSLVEIAIKRGAYQPNEVSAVGKVYDQYVSALSALGEQVKQQASASQSSEKSEEQQASN